VKRSDRLLEMLGSTMNMTGSLGGFVSPIVCCYLVKQTGNWNLAFYVTVAAYLLGAFCWLGMDPVTPLQEQGGGLPWYSGT
jgi:MFS transporter, ACS family, glucarate transporter